MLPEIVWPSVQRVGALGLTNDPEIHTFVNVPCPPGLAEEAAAEGDGGVS